MRIIKLLTIIVVLSAVMLLFGNAASTVFAEQPLVPGQTIEVGGTIVDGYWIQSDVWYFDEDNNLISPGHTLAWILEGDVEGTYVQLIRYVVPYPWDFSVYYIKGQALFSGKVLEVPTSWVTDVDGSGQDTSLVPLVGNEQWDSEILSSAPCMSGAITITGSFDFGSEEDDDYTYTGTLHFDCRNKAK